jgi:flagellar protein FliL
MSKAATMEDAEDGGPTLERKRMSGKKLVLIAVPVLLLLIGLGVAFAMGAFSSKDKAAEAKAAEAADVTITYVDMPDILVNLNTGQGRARFLKLSVTLEVKGPAKAEALKLKLPRISDNFQVYLRELRVEDLAGSAGMFMIKEELLRRVNTELAPDRVEDVLFKEMLVQ